MQCSTNPIQNWEQFRFSNKTTNNNMMDVMQNTWDELIGMYGINVEYYTYNYSLTSHDALYGEDTTAQFSSAVNIPMMADLNNEALILSKFGLQSNADITLVVSTKTYTTIFGATAEPKSGDVIKLTEFGWDNTEKEYPTNDDGDAVLNEICEYRTDTGVIEYPPPAATSGVSGSPWVRHPQLYEITERRYQDFTLNANMLGGHYIWVLYGKRFDYSYQPGIQPEEHMDVVSDETFTGLLSGGLQDPSEEKKYDQNVNDESDADWHYRGEDNPYGNY